MSVFRTIVAVCTVFFALTCFGQQVSTAHLHSLYENSQLFALRDAVEHAKAPVFYRGVVEASLNHLSSAQTDLKAVIRKAPHDPNAYDARGILANLYATNGMYDEASRQLDAMLKEKPNANDVKNFLPLFKALSRYPDQSVVQKKPSTLRMSEEDGNFSLPVTIDGKQANYIFDTGADWSMMSESEAKRLGLSMQTISMKLGGATGLGPREAVRVGIAKNLVIGGLHLKNIAFLVRPDTSEPFLGWKPDERGIIGLPVLLAMQTFRWSPKQMTFSFGFPSPRVHHAMSNFLFKGMHPTLQVGFRHKRLEVALDTGATRSVLYPLFAKQFPKLMKAGKKASRKQTGINGSRNYDSMLLPPLTFQVGGYDTVFKPAYVLLQQSVDSSGWLAGNFGMDQLNQASTITVDFRAMSITLQ